MYQTKSLCKDSFVEAYLASWKDSNLDPFLVIVTALCHNVGDLEDTAVAVLQAIPVGLLDQGPVPVDLVPGIIHSCVIPT